MGTPEPPPEPADDVRLGNLSRLEPFIDLFERHGVDYIVIGGQAEGLMGSGRPTLDTDFCYRRTRDNLERLAVALADLKPTLRGAPPDLPISFSVESLAMGSNYTFNTPFGSFDLLGWVEPVGDYDEVLKRCEEHEVDGAMVKVISLADLIRVKEHLRRQKDQRSLEQLYAIRRRREQGG